MLAIGGSDSSGGAGIQADIKTIATLGGYAAAAITAVTAQDTMGVHAVLPVPPAFVARQIGCVLDDIGADAVKTGMLGNAEVVEVVAQALRGRPADIPVVVDPVMVATGGQSLLTDDGIAALKRLLLPRAAVITPNAPEAEALTGLTVRTASDMASVGSMLLSLGPGAVLIKGGHLPGDQVVDLLVTRDGACEFAGPRILSPHTHGTGCTLASAVATGLAQGLGLRDAVQRAKRYVVQAISRAPRLGRGSGPLGHMPLPRCSALA